MRFQFLHLLIGEMKVQLTQLEIKGSVAHAGLLLLLELSNLVTKLHMGLSIVYLFSNFLIVAIMEVVEVAEVDFKMLPKTT
jgi:hypothetical protein